MTPTPPPVPTRSSLSPQETEYSRCPFPFPLPFPFPFPLPCPLPFAFRFPFPLLNTAVERLPLEFVAAFIVAPLPFPLPLEPACVASRFPFVRREPVLTVVPDGITISVYNFELALVPGFVVANRFDFA